MKLALVACAAALVLGCGKKSHPPLPDVTGLKAVPVSAQAVVSADLATMVDSPLVQRAIDQLLMRDRTLAGRWEQLQRSCKLDPKRLDQIVLAIGPGQGAGTGPVLMVVTGKIVEAELAACVRSMVGQGGGTLTAKPLGGRTLYQAKEGNRTMFFAFSEADTVVLGSNEAYVTEALGTGKKVLDNKELAAWIGLVDPKAPLWAAGKVDERVRGGLVKLTDGKVKAGPVAMIVSANPRDGLSLDVGAVMESTQDAKTLESFAKAQLGLMAMAAQAKSLGKVVEHVSIAADKQVVHFKAALSVDDVNLIISALDGGGITAQDSPPATDAGSQAGAAAGQ